MTDRKMTLCLDFDGVIHSYSSGWKGADVILDPPVPGAMDFIVSAQNHFKVAIYSSRSNEWAGVGAMQRWLLQHMTAYLAAEHGYQDAELRVEANEVLMAVQWPTAKPAAFVTLDDRALQFTGTFPDPRSLLAFKPWNKISDGDRAIEHLIEVERLGALVVGESVATGGPVTVLDVLREGFTRLGFASVTHAADAALERLAGVEPAPAVAAPRSIEHHSV